MDILQLRHYISYDWDVKLDQVSFPTVSNIVQWFNAYLNQQTKDSCNSYVIWKRNFWNQLLPLRRRRDPLLVQKTELR